MNTVDTVWSRLNHLKRGDCVITAEDEVVLKKKIHQLLSETSWTRDEVLQYLRHTEYFDNVTPEDVCLERMRNVVRNNNRDRK